jgi:hypothetical protein
MVPVTVADMTPVRRQSVVARRRDAGPPSRVVSDFLLTLDALRPDRQREPRFLA